MPNTPTNRNTSFREIAGIITAMIVVLLFSGLGVIQVIVFVATGTNIAFDPDYKTALLGLASMALGFLVGSQSDNKPMQAKAQPMQSVQQPETITAQGFTDATAGANVVAPNSKGE